MLTSALTSDAPLRANQWQPAQDSIKRTQPTARYPKKCLKSQRPSYMTGCHRFPLNNFKYFLTLFSKFFSSFPHGTCSLSVSRRYLALDEIYHPIRAAVPNNSTRGTRAVRSEKLNTPGQRRDSHPLWCLVPKNLYPGHYWPRVFRLQLGFTRLDDRFSAWALPASLAVTRGILVSFFSSAY